LGLNFGVMRMDKTLRKILRATVNYDPDYFDMYTDRDEAFASQLYLKPFRDHLNQLQIKPPARILDAGCQTGRLAIPLAKQGFKVTGIDTSGFALRLAKAHAKCANVSLSLIKGDISEVLRAKALGNYDAVLCAEVLYLQPHFRKTLQDLYDALRPGGLLAISHRPKHYYLFSAIKRDDIDGARYVLNNQEGPIEDSKYFNWQSIDELRAIYEQMGCTWLGAYAIDRFAWMLGISPSRLNDEQRRALFHLESSEHPETNSASRYTFIIAQKAEIK